MCPPVLFSMMGGWLHGGPQKITKLLKLEMLVWRWALAQDNLVYQLTFANIYLLLQAVMEMKKKR